MDRSIILNKKEVKKVLALINNQWGCDTSQLSDYVFLKNNKDKYSIVNKELFDFPIDKVRVSKLGLYFGELHKEEFRVSIEGSQLVGRTAKKNVVELNDEQAAEWIRGVDVEIELTDVPNGFLLIKNNNDFYGCGKYKTIEKKLLNYYPKIRRIK